MTESTSSPETTVERLHNEPLAKYNTFKIGGPAEVFSIPRSQEQLISEIKHCESNGIPWKILGNGSNLIIRDAGVKGFVIHNKHALCTMEVVSREEGYGVVEAGSSVLMPQLVKFLVDNGLEGMEYLQSVPGTIGGGIYMNAGRGMNFNQYITDYLEYVTVYDGEKVIEITRDACEFTYRRSVFFDHKNWIILGARFRIPEQDKAIGKKKIAERMAYVRETQARKVPNIGTTFKTCSPKIISRLKGLRIGNAKLVGNWISNLGNARSRDVLAIIWIVKAIHIITRSPVDLENEIW